MEKDTGMNDQILHAALIEWAAFSDREPSSLPEPSEDFLSRARQTARRAAALRKMQDATREIGFQALPLPDYLTHAAKFARVSLASLFKPASGRREQTSQWLEVAKESGLSVRLTHLLMRLWIAETDVTEDFVPVMARAGNDPKLGGVSGTKAFSEVNDEQALEDALSELETSYAKDRRILLNDVLRG